MVALGQRLLAFWLLLVGTSAALAEEVTLTAKDGSLEITGAFLDYDGAVYRLDTIYGPLTINADRVTCLGDACPPLDVSYPTISISGAPLLGDALIPILLEGFAAQSGLSARRTDQGPDRYAYQLTDAVGEIKGVFEVHVSSTEEGFADVLANEADIILAARPINDTEHRRAFDASLGDLRDAKRSQVIALTSLIPVIAPGQIVETVSLQDLERILVGDIKNWSELGGSDAPIEVHLPSSNSGPHQALKALLGGADLAETAIDHPDFGSLVDAVAGTENALGITTFDTKGRIQPLEILDGCGVPIRSRPVTLKTGHYPWTLPLLAYTSERRLPKLARDFLNHTASVKTEDQVRQLGFTRPSIELITTGIEAPRLSSAVLSTEGEAEFGDLQEVVKALSTAGRLSLTFRLSADGVFDVQSLSNQQPLFDIIRVGLLSERSVSIVHFGPSAQLPRQGRQLFERLTEELELAQVEFERLSFRNILGERCLPQTPTHRIELWLK